MFFVMLLALFGAALWGKYRQYLCDRRFCVRRRSETPEYNHMNSYTSSRLEYNQRHLFCAGIEAAWEPSYPTPQTIKESVQVLLPGRSCSCQRIRDSREMYPPRALLGYWLILHNITTQ
jgi:hypothetical protein